MADVAALQTAQSQSDWVSIQKVFGNQGPTGSSRTPVLLDQQPVTSRRRSRQESGMNQPESDQDEDHNPIPTARTVVPPSQIMTHTPVGTSKQLIANSHEEEKKDDHHRPQNFGAPKAFLAIRKPGTESRGASHWAKGLEESRNTWREEATDKKGGRESRNEQRECSEKSLRPLAQRTLNQDLLQRRPDPSHEMREHTSIPDQIAARQMQRLRAPWRQVIEEEVEERLGRGDKDGHHPTLIIPVQQRVGRGFRSGIASSPPRANQYCVCVKYWFGNQGDVYLKKEIQVNLWYLLNREPM